MSFPDRSAVSAANCLRHPALSASRRLPLMLLHAGGAKEPGQELRPRPGAGRGQKYESPEGAQELSFFSRRRNLLQCCCRAAAGACHYCCCLRLPAAAAGALPSATAAEG